MLTIICKPAYKRGVMALLYALGTLLLISLLYYLATYRYREEGLPAEYFPLISGILMEPNHREMLGFNSSVLTLYPPPSQLQDYQYGLKLTKQEKRFIAGNAAKTINSFIDYYIEHGKPPLKNKHMNFLGTSKSIASAEIRYHDMPSASYKVVIVLVTDYDYIQNSFPVHLRNIITPRNCIGVYFAVIGKEYIVWEGIRIELNESGQKEMIDIEG